MTEVSSECPRHSTENKCAIHNKFAIMAPLSNSLIEQLEDSGILLGNSSEMPSSSLGAIHDSELDHMPNVIVETYPDIEDLKDTKPRVNSIGTIIIDERIGLGDVPGSNNNNNKHHVNQCTSNTIRQHYYPEGGWGWVIVVVALLEQILTHGLHMAVGIIMGETLRRFPVKHNIIHTGLYIPEI